MEQCCGRISCAQFSIHHQRLPASFPLPANEIGDLVRLFGHCATPHGESLPLNVRFVGSAGNLLDNFSETHSRDEVQRAVRKYYPDAEVVAVDAHDWSRDPLSMELTGSIGPATPFRFLQAMSKPEARIVFAGTDVADSAWRTWIQGALDGTHHATTDVNTIL